MKTLCKSRSQHFEDETACRPNVVGVSLLTEGDVVQVLAPLMGWVRNYHGYQFFDRSDGATWGPEDSNAIDMMHMHVNGFDYMDDKKTRLAEVLQVLVIF